MDFQTLVPEEPSNTTVLESCVREDSAHRCSSRRKTSPYWGNADMADLLIPSLIMKQDAQRELQARY